MFSALVGFSLLEKYPTFGRGKKTGISREPKVARSLTIWWIRGNPKRHQDAVMKTLRIPTKKFNSDMHQVVNISPVISFIISLFLCQSRYLANHYNFIFIFRTFIKVHKCVRGSGYQGKLHLFYKFSWCLHLFINSAGTIAILTNSMAYGTRKFNVAPTMALQ